MKKCVRLIAIVLVLASLLTYPAMAADAASPGITLTTPNGNVTFDVGIPEGAFSGSTAAYNHELAQTSMVLSYAAANSTENTNGAGNAVHALKGLGFSDARSENTGDTTKLGFAYGTREIAGKTVIAVVFEDTQTTEEWTAAYDFGSGDTVQMFEASASSAVNVVTGLIPSDGSDYCFWVTGFGRGGSCANLLGATLTDTYGTHRVRAYSFAAPAVSTNAVGPGETSKYNNLFTINNPDDIVCYLPLEIWGFAHYGVLLEQHHYANTSLKTNISSNYSTYTGKSFYSYTSTSAVSDHVNYLGTYVMPTIADYEIPRPSYTSTMSKISISAALGAVFKVKAVNVSPHAMVTKLFSTVFAGKEESDYLPLMGDIFAIYYKGYTAKEMYYKDWEEEAIVAESAYFRTIYFAMKHGLGVEGMSQAYSLISDFTTVDALPFKEMLVAYQPESYLAWMMATSNIGDLSSTELPVAEVKYIDEGTGIIVEGDGVFYEDITLEAEALNGGGYSVALKRTSDNTQITAYGPVTISLPLPAENATVYYETAGSQPVEISYEQINEDDQLYAKFNASSWSGGTYRLTVPATESYINITEASDSTLTYSAANINDEEHGAVLYLAAYGENDQMIDVQELGSLEVEQEVAEETIAIPSGWVSIKIFMLDSVSYAPLCEAADYPTQ